MDPERWGTIEALYHRALERPPADRALFLEGACGDDQELLGQVISLLAQGDMSSSLLDSPVWEQAPELLISSEIQTIAEPVSLAGRTLSHYRVTEKLGQGGMGVVWKAVDTNLRRAVALKVLSPSRASEVGLFLREGQMASALNHPNIVTIYEANAADDIHFIAMEYVRGVTLAERLHSGRISIVESIRIAIQVAEALSHAHEAGLVHRDLKPSNVMVTPAGVAKVLDFGIAKQHGPTAEDISARTTTSLTAPGMARGTVAYMSPEQALGDKVDASSDIFSFGIMLYEMLTGSRPFIDSNVSPLRALIERTPAAPRSLVPDLPQNLEAVVMRCLEKDPKARYRNAADLSNELRALLPAPTPPSRRPLYAGAVALLLLIAASIIPSVRNAILSLLPFDRTDPAQIVARNEHDAYRLARACLDRYDKRGNIDRAIEFLNQAISMNRQYAPAYAGLSEASVRRNILNPDPQWIRLAREQAVKAVTLNPDLAAAHVALGASLLAGGNADEAAKEFNKAKDLEPRNPHALAGLAQIAAQDDPKAAEGLFRDAVQLAPSDVYITGEFGVFYFHQARYREAIDVWETSLKYNQDNVHALQNVGAAYQLLDQYEAAASAYQRALEIEPSSTAYNNLGTLRFFQGRYGDAARAFEKAVESAGGNGVRWGNLGDAYRWAPGMREKSKDAYSRAIDLLRRERQGKPNDPEICSHLAKYFALSGNTSAALTELTAFERLQKTPATSFYAAIAYAACGRRDDALRSIEAALRGGYSLKEVENEPELTELRSDARYQRLLISHRNANPKPE